MVCKECGSKMPEEARFCFICGSPIQREPEPAPVPAERCVHCGGGLPKAARFCGACGACVELEPVPVEEPDPMPEDPAPVEQIPVEEIPVEEPDRVPDEPVVEQLGATKLCPSCGQELEIDACFCFECGFGTELEPAQEKAPAIGEPIPEKRCYDCGQPLEMDARFCGVCGTKVEPEPIPVVQSPGQIGSLRHCRHCGTELEEDARFCGVCGRSVDGAVVGIRIPDIGTGHDPVTIAVRKEKEAQKKSRKTGKQRSKALLIGTVILLAASAIGAAVWFFLFGPGLDVF